MGDVTRDSTPLMNDLAFRQVCNRFRDDEFHQRRESFMFHIRTEELMNAIGHVYSVELLCFILVPLLSIGLHSIDRSDWHGLRCTRTNEFGQMLSSRYRLHDLTEMTVYKCVKLVQETASEVGSGRKRLPKCNLVQFRIKLITFLFAILHRLCR